jgi:hypothetical protein
MITDAARDGIRVCDIWLDDKVSKQYQDAPLAQHWARVAKTTEEIGEAINALIVWTGQNPRKPANPSAKHAMLSELADTAITAILGIQHFTKDEAKTSAYLSVALAKVIERASRDGYSLPDYQRGSQHD